MRIIKRAEKLDEAFHKNEFFMYAGTFLCLQSRIVELRTGSTQEGLCNGFHAIQSSDI